MSRWISISQMISCLRCSKRVMQLSGKFVPYPCSMGRLFLMSVLLVFYTFKNHIHPIFVSSVLPWLLQVPLPGGKDCVTILRTCWERSLDTKPLRNHVGADVPRSENMAVLYIKIMFFFYTIFKIPLWLKKKFVRRSSNSGKIYCSVKRERKWWLWKPCKNLWMGVRTRDGNACVH